MKKSRFLKRAAAVAAAAALALCACFGGALADEEETVTVPSDSDSATVTVYNVEEGATVTAYQIVDAEYGDYGFTGYTYLISDEDVAIADLENPTADEITAIAQWITNNKSSESFSLSTVTLTGGTDSTSNEYVYSGSLTVGMWVILVSGTSEEIYNPMIVSLNYTDSGDASTLYGGYADADGNFTVSEESDGTTVLVAVYAKSSEVSITKQIITGTDDSEDATSSAYAATADVGDSVSYEISTTMPDYAYEDTTLVFTITDTWTEGLDAPESLSVKVGDDTYTIPLDSSSYTDSTYTDTDSSYTVTCSDSTYTVTTTEDDTSTTLFTVTIATTSTTENSTDADGNETTTEVYTGGSLAIAFEDEYIDANGGKAVTVTYSQEVNESAVVETSDTDVDNAMNTASLTYTDGISTFDSSNTETQSTKTTDGVSCYVYTFEIDGEIVKVDADPDSEGNYTVLPGATFTLYTDESCSTVYTNDILTDGTITTGEDGLLVISGLDAGTYYLVETEAPDGYALNDDVYEIVIYAEIGTEDGVIDSYTVTVTNLSSYDSDETSDTYGTYTESLTNTYTCKASTSEDDTETTTYTWTINGETETVSALKILNTSLTSLPSTGGMGTMVFTAVGIILIAAAVCVFVVYFRKQKRNSSGE